MEWPRGERVAGGGCHDRNIDPRPRARNRPRRLDRRRARVLPALAGAFSIDGAVVASYAAFSKQCGLYVLPHAIAAHADEIAAHGLKATKTGITFTPRKPIPDDLVERLATTARSTGGG